MEVDETSVDGLSKHANGSSGAMIESMQGTDISGASKASVNSNEVRVDPPGIRTQLIGLNSTIDKAQTEQQPGLSLIGTGRKFDAISNPLAISSSSLPHKRKTTEKKKETALTKNLPPSKKIRLAPAQDPAPRYDAGYSYDSELNGGVSPTSLDPRTYSMGGQAVMPAVRYVQKMKQRYDLPSHGGIDLNHHETSYGSYTNQGHHASGRGKININHQTTNYQYSSSNPLEELKKQCSSSAAFDSAARFDPPRCAESTRLGIIQTIEEWINGDGDGTAPSSLFWLHGGAGVGKSALAQSLSEKYQENKQLGGSFFFFRGDPTRSDGGKLIPTLVSHLVDAFEGVVPFVEDRIQRNRALFTKKFQVQIQELLVGPLLTLKSTGSLLTPPRLIVIDGLDECKDQDIQCELLRVIACAIPCIPYPLRFLVTSRPEAHIIHVFNHDRDLQAIRAHRYNLSDDPDADVDIRTFLGKEFEEIRRVHRVAQHLPHDWPDQEAITSLVERSSGHFIYASTVIRYIRSLKHRPDDRLEVILRLRPPQDEDRPYAQLDALYALIFEGIETHHNLETICLVLGILYFGSSNIGYFMKFRAYVATIEELLEMKAGDLVLLLDPILSLVAVDCGKVRILHKSLTDYLLDVTRSGDLPFDLARVHELGASHILKKDITIDPGKYPVFAYHCRYGHLNDGLKNYLHSLEVPCPSPVPKMFPPWDSRLNISLRGLMWYFFRVLSREDFDSTGQVHKTFLEKWMVYFVSFVPRRSQHRQSKVLVDELDDLKCTLDKLLMAWNPTNFTPMDVGMTRHVAIIEQEHKAFSAYAEASFSSNTDAITSSLVFGDHFIHSYNLATWDREMHLILRTYSRHNNACYEDHVPLKVGDDIIQATTQYLKKAEKYLFSHFHQKYGIAPEEDTLYRK